MTSTITAGALRTVVRAGDRYHRVGAASVNDEGEIAFVATDSRGPAIIWAGAAVVRAGERAPCGRAFTAFPEIDLGTGGQLVFRARLTGSAEGVFLLTPQGIRSIAVTGDRYTSFESVTLASTVLEDGPYHRIAFLARQAGGRVSLMIHPSYTEPAEVLTTGTRLGEDTVEELAISRVGFSVGCVASVRRSGSLVRTIVIAHEGAVAWAPGAAEGEEFDGLPAITRIIGAPGCHSEIAFAAVELRGGDSAVLARPVLADPEILARTGDPAPGLDGVCLERFGAPVASSGLPAHRPFGLASTVRCDDGRAAVWVAALDTATPFSGRTVLPVLDGEPTDDGLAVHKPEPLVLTNTGILLLRAELAGRPGLVLIDHLLDG